MKKLFLLTWFDKETKTEESQVLEADDKNIAIQTIYEGMGDETEDIIEDMQVEEIEEFDLIDYDLEVKYCIYCYDTTISDTCCNCNQKTLNREELEKRIRYEHELNNYKYEHWLIQLYNENS